MLATVIVASLTGAAVGAAAFAWGVANIRRQKREAERRRKLRLARLA